MSGFVKSRSDLWLYMAKEGILQTFFRPSKNGDDALHLWISDWIQASLKVQQDTPQDRRLPYRILDTFLSDTLIPSHIGSMLDYAQESGVPFQVLLADPTSQFARARAESLRQSTFSFGDEIQGIEPGNRSFSATRRSARGLGNLLKALTKAATGKRIDTEDLEPATILRHLRAMEEELNFEIRFYNDLPSGAMFFLGGLLIYGYYCARRSSRDAPWDLVVDHPGLDDDRYDIFKHEFDDLWENGSTSTLGTGESSERIGHTETHQYFLSYSHQDEELADHVELLLRRAGRLVFRDSSLGRPVAATVSRKIAESDTFLCLWSRNAASSEWVSGELEQALDRNIPRIVVLELDKTPLSSPRANQKARANAATREARALAVSTLLEQEDSGAR